MNGRAPGHYNELVGVVVVAQLDALGRENGLGEVHHVAEFFDFFEGGEVGAGNYVVGVADSLVVSYGLHDFCGTEVCPGRVSSRADKTRVVKHFLDLLCRVTEEARKFHVFVAEIGNFSESIVQVYLCDISYTVKLKSVI